MLAYISACPTKQQPPYDTHFSLAHNQRHRTHLLHMLYYAVP